VSINCIALNPEANSTEKRIHLWGLLKLSPRGEIASWAPESRNSQISRIRFWDRADCVISPCSCEQQVQTVFLESFMLWIEFFSCIYGLYGSASFCLVEAEKLYYIILPFCFCIYISTEQICGRETGEHSSWNACEFWAWEVMRSELIEGWYGVGGVLFLAPL
jgi:hypothetical protein